jgi:hypothetical protein
MVKPYQLSAPDVANFINPECQVGLGLLNQFGAPAMG